jgi:radical SAM superfamily enzyme YgiQ (UPF0313 family)
VSDVVLVQPSVRAGRERQRRISLPIGLLCLAGTLLRDGHRVEIIDQYFEPDWEDRLRTALARDPVCVGLSVKTGPQIRNALDVSRTVKSRGGVPVVWGGVHPSLLPEQTLAHPDVDVVVRGEGEETFAALVAALGDGGPLEDVRGISYLDDGRYRATPARPHIDLDAQPPLPYHLVDVDRYRVKIFGIDHLRVSSSRGCSHRCGFCYNVAFNDSCWRAQSVEKTIEMLATLREEHGVRGFTLADDYFFRDLDRVRGILERVLDRGLDVVFSKLDAHAADLPRLDGAFLDLLERAGCRTLVVGVESGSERTLKLIRKRFSIGELLAFNRRVRDTKIVPKYCFMLGFPTETEEDVRETVDLMLKLIDDNPNIIKDINLYTPYPGTELFDLAVEHGFRPPESLGEWSSFNWSSVNRARTPWIDDRRARLLEMLHFSTCFLEKRNYLDPVRKTGALTVLLARLYHPLARLRVERLWHRFPIEIRLARWLGLYRRQE